MISNLKDSYIKKSFTTRINAIKVSATLNEGNCSETEAVGLKALDTNEHTPFNILINMNIGNAFIMYDFDKAMYYFKRAISLCDEFSDEIKRIQVQHSIDFCKAYWKIDTKPEDINVIDVSSKYNKIFAYIAIDDKGHAFELLESIDIEEITDDEKAFHFFYRGMVTREKEDFYQSIEYFRTTYDKHYRNLSIIELRKMGENEFLLKALSA